jgi:two-component system, chemotaxis family, protein-glutamate methylesterase/glutaminase
MSQERSSDAVVVVGASAGGVEALRELVGGLSADLRACVMVVLHIPATGAGALPAILDRAGPLPATHATEGQRVLPGRILVAPPDHHVVVVDGRVTLTRGPTENGHRPAVDVLFRSAARAYGSRVFGVVLSGSMDDGAAGCISIRERGGRCLVQDFDEALYDGMPRAAAAAANIDTQVKASEMPELVSRWLDELPAATAGAPSWMGDPVDDLIHKETQMAELNPTAMHDHDRPGTPSGYGCPDCGGALYAIEEGPLRRFRCRVGHAWSPESLMARQTVGLESALWMALRSLEEKVALNTDLGSRARADGSLLAAASFERNAGEALRSAELVRRLVAELGRGDETPATEDN